MWQAGLSVTDIAEVVEVSRTTVYWWIKRWKIDGSILTKPRSGRPRVTTKEQEAKIAALVRDKPNTTSEMITQELNLSCCPATTRKRVRENTSPKAPESASKEKGKG